MNKKLLIAIGIIVVFIVASFIFNSYIYNQKQALAFKDYKNAIYMIDGKQVQLKDGFSEMEAAPGSASKITTRYFGNELKTDLDGDGVKDVVFLLSQETGGTGIFFYAVAALNTPRGYIGSDGYFLGDRIAPQTTEVSRNTKHKYVVVINYADHALGEPMIIQPTVGKSAYLKLNPTTMQWGIVLSPAESEAL